MSLFPLKGKQKVPASVTAKIRDHLQSLEAEFTRRYQDTQKTDPQCNLLSYPITADVYAAPHEMQLVLFDMQADHTAKEMFNAVTVVDFYKYLSSENVHALRNLLGKCSPYLDLRIFVKNVKSQLSISPLILKKFKCVTGYICLIKLGLKLNILGDIMKLRKYV